MKKCFLIGLLGLTILRLEAQVNISYKGIELTVPFTDLEYQGNEYEDGMSMAMWYVADLKTDILAIMLMRLEGSMSQIEEKISLDFNIYDPPMSSAIAAKSMKSGLTAEFPDATILTHSARKFNGYSGYSTTINLPDISDMTLYMFYDRGFAYVVAFTSSENTSTADKRLIDNILRTLKLPGSSDFSTERY